MRHWRCRVFAAVLVVVGVVAPAAARGNERGSREPAQERRAETRAADVPPGAFRLDALAAGRVTIYVTDANGLERTGRLVAVDADGLRVEVAAGVIVLPWNEVAIVRRHGDPVWDGFLKGAAIGGGINLLMVASAGSGPGDGTSRAGWVAGAVLTWGLVGALVDAMHVGRTKVFVSPRYSTDWRSDMIGRRGLVFGARWSF